MSVLIERAPAKVNLSLHIMRRREDGWHDLESLAAFTGTGDVLTLDQSKPLSLTCEGAYAAAAGAIADNLVLKAARALADICPNLRSGEFRLIKKLPAAAGIGGGSSDAAATLRLLARANNLPLDDARLYEAARSTGADVAVCLDARARMMTGTGGELGPVLDLPPLYAVLVNPGPALETKDVFARLNLARGETYAMSRHPDVAGCTSGDELLDALQKTRNDMEDAASVLAPVIADVLAVLGAARNCRLARMSGSGATCFGLFELRQAASRAAAAIRKTRPQWWVKTAVLR